MRGRAPRRTARTAARGGPERPKAAREARLAGAARRLAVAAGCAALLLGTAACDNIVKYVGVFATMVDGPAAETYERPPTPPPEGAVPVSGRPPSFALPVADTTSALQNPLTGTAAELQRGEQVYTDFCLPCHGPEGRGRGPVINNDPDNQATNARMPFIPAVDLTSGTGPRRSDGYVWGIIHNGRGLMPSYRRVPRADRWHVIEYVRQLQRQAGAQPVRGVAGPEERAAGAAASDAAPAADTASAPTTPADTAVADTAASDTASGGGR